MNTSLCRCAIVLSTTLLFAACGKKEAAPPGVAEEVEPGLPVLEPAAVEPQRVVQIDREKASRLGVTTNEISKAISEAFGDQPLPAGADLTRLTVRSMSGELVPLSSVATLSFGPGASDIQKADAAFLDEMKAPAVVQAPPKPADDRAAYEAWFKKYDLDLNDPTMLDGDADNDGFTNRDEFLAGTNPRDPNSHPAANAAANMAHPAIRMKEYSEVRLPLILESVRGEKAVIRRSGGGETGSDTVRVGDTVRGFPLRVAKVSERQVTDKDGNPLDRSQIVLEDTTTKASVTLVKDLPAKTADTYAVLASDDGKTSIKVHAGEVFTWPGEPPSTYRVVDLSRDQITLQEQENRKMWTIPRQ